MTPTVALVASSVALAFASVESIAVAAPPDAVASEAHADDAGRASPLAADAPTPAVNGMYPLWEQTGALESAGAVRVGWQHADVGLGPVEIGTQPFLDLYRAPNAQVKVAILARPRLRLAIIAGATYLPVDAEQTSIGNLNASTYANPFASVTLLPVSAAATYLLTPRLHLHASATVLTTLSSEPAYRGVTGGVAAFAEWFATTHWSARLHAGAEGWPTTPEEHIGLSFGWSARHLALAAGYARRFDPDGTSAGVVMLDAALLFP